MMEERRVLEGPYELPEGWEWTPLSDACEIIMGQSPPSDTYNAEGIGLPFFQGKAEFGALYPTPVKWCSNPGKIAEAGDVLISVRAPVGPTNLCRERSCIGRGLAAIRPFDGMPARYFLYALRLYQDQLVEKATGTTFQAISGKVLRDQLIPLAPTREQVRIVAKIEELLTSLDAGVAGLKRVQAALKRYRSTVLKAACEGRLVPQDPNDEPAEKLLERILAERRAKWEADLRAKGKDPQKAKYAEPKGPDTEGLPELPEGWCWATVEQLSTKVVDGTHFTPQYLEEGIAFLSVKDIRGGVICFDDCRFISVDEHNDLIRRCHPEIDDVLITKSGTIGRIAIVKTLRPFSLFVSVALIKTLKRHFSQAFFELALAFYVQNIDVQQDVKGGLIKNLHLEDLRIVSLRLAPISEQHRIVTEVERRLSVVSQLEKLVAANLVRAERLRQAILRRAFEGKLVGQEAGDVPGSALLERTSAQGVAGHRSFGVTTASAKRRQ